MKIHEAAKPALWGAAAGAVAISVVGFSMKMCAVSNQGALPTAAMAQFYVSPSGSDTSPGTLAQPFKTITRAQQAMRLPGAGKITYVRAGRYTFAPISNCNGDASCGILMTSADNGTTISYYPSDGIGSADLTGNSTAAGNGLFSIFNVDDTDGVTITGLSLHNFQYAAILSFGGTKNLVVTNNLIYNGFNATGGNPGAFSCYGCFNTTISHNMIDNIAGAGIAAVQVNGDIAGFLATGNYLQNTCTRVADCGAIYVQDPSGIAKNIKIINNYIRDGNTFATLGAGGGSAIYLDDCTSYVAVSGNVLAGRNGSNTILTHGGSYNVITGNLTDLATYGQSASVYQTSDLAGCSNGAMIGNRYQGNVLISGGGGGGFELLSGSPLHAPAILNNNYFNYAGSPISYTGSYTDTNVTHKNPLLNCWEYTIEADSPAVNLLVAFPGIPSSWGHVGFVIPHTGTPPSNPHTTC